MENKIYVIHALAVSEIGSFGIPIQGVKIANGSGNVVLTGNLSPMAKEVVNVAISYLRLQGVSFENSDYHIHMLHTDKLKDGYSWGLCAYIMLAWLTDFIPYQIGLAASGQIDLYGNVLPVGGLDEKMSHWLQSYSGKLVIPKLQGIFNASSGNEGIICVSHVNQLKNLVEEMV